MSNFLFYLAAFGLVLGILIVVHEWGHYAVARLCGVKVLKFSVGFGRPLWQRSFGRDQTQWALGVFPLGGYVKMLDEREGEAIVEHELPRAFNRQSVWRRMAIVSAGPLANLVLAFLIFWGVFWNGTDELRPVIGTPPAASVAAEAGLREGDRILSVNSGKVETWEDVRWRILQLSTDESSVSLEVINPQNEISSHRLSLSPIRDSGWEGDAFEQIGLAFYRPVLPPVFGRIVAGSVADRAGLQVGDRVLSVDDAEIATWKQMAEKIFFAPGKDLSFEILRGDSRFRVTLTPEVHEEKGKRFGRIGVEAAQTETQKIERFVRIRHGVFEAAGKAFRETWEKSVFSLTMLGKMLTGEVSWRNLSGPVTIADYAGQTAKLGLEYYIRFIALVSISLGVLNLLPIPILDGGHLMYYVVEIIRRRPLSEKTMEFCQKLGLAVLVMLMVFAFYNDINRLISS